MDKYLQEIKTAKSKDELRAITYRAFCDNTITGKQDDILTACSVWKENQIKGADKAQLDNCVQVLKIPKKYINLIK